MNKMDEMDRSIKLRADAIGYKAALLALVVWILYDLWSYWFNGGAKNILPTTLTSAVLIVQQFSMLSIKRKMTAGDDEYREPNQILRLVVLIIVAITLVLSAGSYLSSLGAQA